MEALTRNQILKEWLKQNESLRKSFCCPDCRNILINYSGTLMCNNDRCLNNQEFKPNGELRK